MVRPSSRGGVPVFSRPCGSLSSFSRAESDSDGGSPARPACEIVEPDMDAAVQERARGQHHCPRAEPDADLGDGAHHPVALHHQVVHRLLEQHQVRLVFQPRPDRRLVEQPVGLRPGGAHGRPLGAVEDAELDPGLVGGHGHRPAQGIHLLDQVALADAADRRVAAHLAERLDVVGQQQRLAAHARRGQGSLGPGMAAADHDDVEFLWIKHGEVARAAAGCGRKTFDFIGAGIDPLRPGRKSIRRTGRLFAVVQSNP